MPNLSVTQVRSEKGSQPISGSTLFPAVHNGEPLSATLDEISNAINGQTIPQGMQDPHQGAEVILGQNSTTVVISAGATTWDGGAIRDTNGAWNAGASSRLTMQPGTTQVEVFANITPLYNSGELDQGDADISIVKNGTDIVAFGTAFLMNNNGFFYNVVALHTPPLNVVATDYFEVVLSKRSGDTSSDDGRLTLDTAAYKSIFGYKVIGVAA